MMNENRRVVLSILLTVRYPVFLFQDTPVKQSNSLLK